MNALRNGSPAAPVVMAAVLLAVVHDTGSAAGRRRPVSSVPAVDRGQVEALARDALLRIQAVSIAQNIEYCGNIVLSGWGMTVDGPYAGSSHGCRTPDVAAPDRLLATYHTHAAHSRGGGDEYPSRLDFASVRRYGGEAYMATPGGRFLVIRHSGAVALLCRCMPRDEGRAVARRRHGSGTPDPRAAGPEIARSQ